MPSGASKVAFGILLSRLAGFVREVVVAAALGAGPFADVFRFLLRAPNLLQNMFGEQTLSAALIPAYSRRLQAGDRIGAKRLAATILGWLLVIVAAMVVLGVLLAKPFVALVAPGWLADATAATGPDRYQLATVGVRWMFPAMGVLVLSAWALAILNSHRKFLVSYTAPVAWNLAIIGAFVGAAAGWFGFEARGADLVLAGVAGVVVGSVLQLVVQLPFVTRAAGSVGVGMPKITPEVREVARAMGPLVAGRGVVQLSAYLDTFLASFIAAAGLSVLGYAQTLYLLPVSLLGMSAAAAELPELARGLHGGSTLDLRPRVVATLRQVAVLAVPAAVGFVFLGLPLIRTVYERGRFNSEASTLTWLVLAAYGLGLVATIASRQLQNVFIAAGKTKTPARIAALRVAVSTVIGVPAMFYLDELGVPGFAHGDYRLGAVGLAIGSGLAAWSELAWLRRALSRLGLHGLLPIGLWVQALALAAAAAAVAWGVRIWIDDFNSLAADLVTLGCYAGFYVIGARILGWLDWTAWLRREER